MSDLSRLARDLFGGLTPEGPPGEPFGKFTLVRELGRGGMARVHLAWDRELRRYVALKIVESGPDPRVALRVQREARAAAALDHPGIVRVHGLGEVDGKLYIEMSYVEGRPLSSRIGEEAFPTRDRIRVLAGVARAVAYAHERGVIHRDLKPSNVLLDSSGEPHLLDFGLAETLTHERLRLTRTGALAGTPGYMAPEQVRGRECDPRADVYALGVMLYELLTRKIPFEGASLEEVMKRILHEEPVPPRRRDARIAADLETLCLRAIEKEWSRRTMTAGELAQDLERWLAGEPVRARAPSSLRRAWKSFRRRKALVLPAAAIGLLLLGFAGSRLLDSRRPDEGARNRLTEAERYRKLQERLKPVEALLLETRPFFYVKQIDLRPKLQRVEEALRGLQAVAEDPEFTEFPDAWKSIGLGWHLLGDDEPAERALLMAHSRTPQDADVNLALCRIYLERCVFSMMEGPGEGAWGEQQSLLKEWGGKALRHLERSEEGWTGAREIDRHIARAYRTVSEGGKGEVLKLCEEGKSRYPGEAGVEEYWNLEGILVDAPAERVRIYTKALEVRPHYPLAHFMRGAARLDLRENESALADFDAALALHPRFVEALLNRGEAKLRGEDREGAIRDFDRAVELRPDFASAWYGRGMCRFHFGEHPKALADFEEAVRLAPRWASAVSWRGMTRDFLGDVEGARRDHDEAVLLKPQEPSAYSLRAYHRHRQGDFDGAIEDYGEALRLGGPNAEWLANRGIARRCVGDRKGALADLDESIRLAPRFAPSYNNRGAVRSDLREWAAAIEDFSECLRIDPSNPEAYRNRGLALRALHQEGAALEDFHRALELAPADWPYRHALEEFLAGKRPHP